MASDIKNENRRDFMRSVASQCLGVSFAGAVGSGSILSLGEVQAATTPAGKAKHIIYLFMEGAMTHLDTFDPKTDVPEAGETKPIQTRVPGIVFGDRFPKLAYLAGALAVVRSLSTETGAHDKAQYLMRTSYKKLNSIQHPGMGAWMLSQQGRLNRELPGNFLVGGGNRHPGSGFLEPALSPVPIANPSSGIKNIKLPDYLPESLFQRRLLLAEKFDTNFQTSHRSNQKIEAYNQLYTEARNLMGSDHLKVFDLKDEPENVREAYGDNTLGQGCLLARRLVQSGARFVEVTYGGWDMHQDLYNRLDERASQLDNALGILLKDLHRTGLLDETLVVLTTEFGRKPSINANAGRDHHPGAFCSLLAGAGIKGGQVYGASDKRGFSVDDSQMSVADFNKTIAAAAGLPLDKELFSPNGRPFKIGGDGEAIEDLLS
ncbi:DUF1501 domain-containing protein [Stieleria sp. JC731]|uniref:DUF1501 domain-containing protein n=1 Tax=Pirellulaceae TaxID=2691357 RepID=UPI001E29BAFF|nr:DUF1501 domain-containing protein [Stieleria sp. JC731]MCC9603227.1 DUF1501 domain-containing protein [Stieleria sp. JC731]